MSSEMGITAKRFARFAVKIGALVSVALIGVLSLIPATSIQRSPVGGHAEHICVYALATAACLIGWPRHVLWIVTVFYAYAGVLEYLQSFSSTREAKVSDFVASAGGITLALVLMGAIQLFTRPRRR